MIETCFKQLLKYETLEYKSFPIPLRIQCQHYQRLSRNKLNGLCED